MFIARLRTKPWATQILIFILISQLQLAIITSLKWYRVIFIHRFISNVGWKSPVLCSSYGRSFSIQNKHRIITGWILSSTANDFKNFFICQNILKHNGRHDFREKRHSRFSFTCSHHNFCAFETERKHCNNINWNIYLEAHAMESWFLVRHCYISAKNEELGYNG